MSVIVRLATYNDASAIAEFEEKLILQHQEYDQERFSIQIERKPMELFYGNQTKVSDSAVLVAEIEGKLVGFAFVQFEAKNFASLLESAAWLHDLYIDETARGHNVGKLLLESVIQSAKDLGATKLMLTAAAKNEIARKFFKNNGFKTTMVEMMLSLT